MLTLHTYGVQNAILAQNLTSSSYYFLGIADNKAKFANGGAVEAGWLMGFGTPPQGTNLPLRAVKTYTNVQSPLRFGTVLSGTFQVVPSITGKRMNVSPLDIAWTVYH